VFLRRAASFLEADRKHAEQFPAANPRGAVLGPRGHRRPQFGVAAEPVVASQRQDRKSTRLNSSHLVISYAVFCLKKKKNTEHDKAQHTEVADETPRATWPCARAAADVCSEGCLCRLVHATPRERTEVDAGRAPGH